MEVYLDNAATTKVFPKAAQRMLELMETEYGNPSSLHQKGFKAEQAVKEAREQIARSLKVLPKEIIFTSGGTEANNMALFGAAMAKKRTGKHIITSCFEHASVSQPLLFLEQQGFFVDFVPVNRNGQIDPKQLSSMVREDTILVSVMYVNNEVGAIQQIGQLARAVKAKNKNTLFHSDAIQAYGKLPIVPKREEIDLLSVSGHKLHGPKGSGFLYIKEHVKVLPLLLGGGQQQGMRSGTENVPAIAGLGEAVNEYFTEPEQKRTKLYECKQRLVEQLEQLEGVVVHAIASEQKERSRKERILQTAPHIVSAGFAGISRSEVLLHALEERGIYVSSGSACSSNHPGISSSLQAIGVEKEFLNSTLRFSFSLETTVEEIDYTIETLKELLPKLRRFTKR